MLNRVDDMIGVGTIILAHTIPQRFHGVVEVIPDSDNFIYRVLIIDITVNGVAQVIDLGLV